MILPYLECDPLYRRYRFDEPWDGPNNRKLLYEMPSLFACPSRPVPVRAGLFGNWPCGLLACSVHDVGPHNGMTSYAVPLGGDTAFPGIRSVSLSDITDGTSNTFLLGECTGRRIPWTKPDDVRIDLHPQFGDPDGFSGPHQAGVMMLRADGTVTFMKLSTPQSVIEAFFTRNGGETISGHY